MAKRKKQSRLDLARLQAAKTQAEEAAKEPEKRLVAGVPTVVADTPPVPGMDEISAEDLRDPGRLLAVIRDLITGRRSYDVEQARRAVNAVYVEHANQLRLFLVASAKAKLSRVTAAMDSIERIEGVLLNRARLENATEAQLIRLYTFCSQHADRDLAFVRTVSDMELEISKVTGVVPQTSGIERVAEVLASVPDPDRRTKIRETVDKVLEILREEEAKIVDVVPAATGDAGENPEGTGKAGA